MPTPHDTLYFIPLTHGQFACIDADDFARIAAFKWKALWNPDIRGYYAVRYRKVDGKQVFIYMHREVLGLVKGDKKYADHKDHHTLNNRRGNLRIATNEENGRNSRRKRNNSSGVTGVAFWKRDGNWQVHITVNRKQIFLGYRKSKEEAIALRRAAEEKYYGEFAYRTPSV